MLQLPRCENPGLPHPLHRHAVASLGHLPKRIAVWIQQRVRVVDVDEDHASPDLVGQVIEQRLNARRVGIFDDGLLPCLAKAGKDLVTTGIDRINDNGKARHG